MNDQQAFVHFSNYGIKEGRRYKIGQKKELHPVLSDYLDEKGLSFLLDRNLLSN